MGLDNLPGISVELYEVLLPGGMLNDRETIWEAGLDDLFEFLRWTLCLKDKWK